MTERREQSKKTVLEVGETGREEQGYGRVRVVQGSDLGG